MRFILKKIFLTTGVFFIVNIILLLSLKGFHTLPEKIEPTPNVEPLRTQKSQTFITSKISSVPKIDAVLPVLVFGCNRPHALQTHIEALLRTRRNPNTHPIIVSLDCHDDATVKVAQNFGDQVKTLIQLPDLGPINVPGQHSHMAGYYKIARHYNYSINYVLNVLDYEAVIITEDDLEVSQDFLGYFEALYPLLTYDQSLWCISAWNDNGIEKKIAQEPILLHRTDFFPGLGWLLKKTIWNEIKANWPVAFWDDWMRLPEQRRDRACIRPEMSRTAISPDGKKGVSQGQHYDRYLKKIVKNNEPVNWKSIDVTYLIKDRYDSTFLERINACPVITVSDLGHLKSDMKCAQVRYSNEKEFVAIADTLEIMNDFKSNVPRTAYLGIVQCRYGSATIYVTPNQRPWKGYGS